MNAEQKQRAIKLITYWRNRSITTMPEEYFVSGDCMTDLLQELIDAPEPEPVGYTNETELDYVRKYEALPVSGTFWPTSDEDACVALYTAPPANNQSEQQLEMVNAPAPSVPDGWRPFLTDVITAAGLLEHGKRDKGLAGRIGKFAFDAMRAAPTPAEPPTDLPTWENGDDPLVGGGLISRGVVDFAIVGTWPTKPAPSVLDGWRLVPYTPTVLMLERAEYAVNNRPQPSKYEPSATPAIIFWTAMLNYAPEAPTPAEPPADLDAPEFSDGCEKEGFPGGCARMGCCKQLPATANPARTGSSQIEPPADLVRDAERWLSEHDLELLVTFGMQADDCDADGHTLSKEQTRRLCELGVLRNVGFGRHEMTAFGDSIFGVHFSQGISLPLQTHAEYNAAIEREKLKGQS